MTSLSTRILAATLLAAWATMPATAQDSAPAASEAEAPAEPQAETPAEGGAETEAPAEDAAPAEGEAPAEPDAAAEGDAATDAPATEGAAAQLPDNVDIETFGAWELRCETGGGACFIYQLANDSNGNPVAEMTVIQLPDGNEAAAGATAITPLGTMLTAGFVLQVDSGQARQYPYTWCTRSGCFSRFGLTDAEINAMKAGAVARAQIVSASAPEQPVILELSLSGFTAAWNALSEKTGGN